MLKETSQKSAFISHYLLVSALTLFWGLNWPAMKIILFEVPVWWFRAICLIGGGVGLMTIAIVTNQKIVVPKKEWKPLFCCWVFLIIGWHLFTGYGVSQMPAGRAVIIAFTMPLWATILSGPLLSEVITKQKIMALIIGMIGLAVLIGPHLIVLKVAPIGSFLMMGGAFSWAVGTVLFKRVIWSASTIGVAGWLLLVGSIPLTVGAILIGPIPDLDELSLRAVISMIYVLIFPMTFCQWSYLKVVRFFPANVAAISTLAIPLVGVFSSALLLEEHIGIQEIIALILISMALGYVLFKPNG